MMSGTPGMLARRIPDLRLSAMPPRERIPSDDSAAIGSVPGSGMPVGAEGAVAHRPPIPCRAGRARGALFRMVRAAVLLAATVVTADHVFVTSFRPHRVQGGSMVPCLIGEHHRVTCDGCGRGFAVLPMPDGRLPPIVVCPHCGRRVAISTENATWHVGDLVWNLRSPYFFRRPRRWEMVGLRDPAAASRMLVKRIVGLPGESVAIREGDLFVNGRICRKPWPLVREMSAPLPLAEDSRGPRALPCPVRLASPATNYCHFHPGWDQLEFPTRDLVLLFSLTEFSAKGKDAGGKLKIRADDGDRGWIVTFDFAAKRMAIEQGGTEDDPGGMELWTTLPRVLENWVRRPNPKPPLPVAVSLVDRRLLVAVQDRPVFESTYDPPPLTRSLIQPFVVEAEGATGRLADLRVLRDVYYLPPYDVVTPTPEPLPNGKAGASFDSRAESSFFPLRLPGEEFAVVLQASFTVRVPPGKYLVLGDDSHSSMDGRYWRPDFCIASEQILGRTVVLRMR